MDDRILNVASDFNRFPGPRYRSDGPWSGEVFREEVLAPALRSAIAAGKSLCVSIDGVAGYGSSFLDEAFAGLIRHGFSYPEVKSHLRIIAVTSRFQHHKVRIEKYIQEEGQRH